MEIPYSRCFSLILDAIIQKVCFTNVLIDRGRALNILFASALKKLGLSKQDLTAVDSLF